MHTRIVCTLAIVVLAAPPLAAQHGHSSAPKPPSPHVQSTAAHGNVSHATPAHTASTTHGTVTHGSSAHVASHATPSKKTSTSTTTTRTSTTTSTATKSTTGSSTTLTPVQIKLQHNTHLASKLQARLPSGTSLNAAAAGFRNLGQFVAAVNVSNNLGIPFAQLKTRMVDEHMSLGQAIQDSRPTTTDSTTIASHAETEADIEIRSTTTTTTTTTSTTTTSRKAAPKTHGGSL